MEALVLDVAGSTPGPSDICRMSIPLYFCCPSQIKRRSRASLWSGPSPPRLREPGNLFIYCSLVRPDEELVLYRVHNGVEIPESQDDQFSGRVQSNKDVLREGRIRLHVSRLRTEDSGLYQCGVRTEDGFNSAECRLKVFVPVKVVGHDPIHAKVGDDVILPCHLEPPYDVYKLIIEWRFKSQIIHVHHSRVNDDETPNDSRTFMFPDEFEKGNISLKLTKVTKEDEGNYTCFVPKLQSQVKKGNVTLILDENGSQSNWTDTRGTNPGDTGVGGIIGAFVGGGVLGTLITYCVLRCSTDEQVFPCWSKNSQHEQLRNDEDCRENVDPGNEAEVEIPLQDLGQN
ncbi:uncharacterized protein LOC129351327 [Poeciliopsis prolifica]|uniref:uncharacterized protein LOC129351327 n=1 Tax=Poeciliopsis prolifica TaxID=188132 RepID=UPI00241429E6|nr:uncharacterized protein LOC129351327 [Poeciliopsis prolifica]